VNTSQAGRPRLHPFGGLNDLNGVSIGLCRHPIDGKKCFVLTREQNPSTRCSEVQGSVSQPIARKEKSAASSIPERESKLPGYLLKAVDTELGKELYDENSVTGWGWLLIGRMFEQTRKLGSIVNGTVEDDYTVSHPLDSGTAPAHA
jgi:hypothetical protein